MLLKEEWEDEQECAKAIIVRLDEMRERDRDYYVLAVQNRTEAGIVTRMYGPFGTRHQAEQAYRKGVGQVSNKDKVQVFKMTTPLQAELADPVHE
jgi:hypothetical protein